MAALTREAFSQQDFEIGAIGRALKQELLHDHSFNAEEFSKELQESATAVSTGVGLVEQTLALDKGSAATECAPLKGATAQLI